MRCHECEAGVAVQPRYCTCCGRPLESVAPLTAEPFPLVTPASGAAAQEEPPVSDADDPAPFDPIALVEAGFADVQDEPPAPHFDDAAPFEPIALLEAGFADVQDEPPAPHFDDAAPFEPIALVAAGFADVQDEPPAPHFDDAAPFEPIALLEVNFEAAPEELPVPHFGDPVPFEPIALVEAATILSGEIHAGPSDTAPGVDIADTETAARVEPIALVEADGDGVIRTDDRLAEAVRHEGEVGEPDAPEDAVAAFDGPLVAPVPWWQGPRVADRGTPATASLDQDPVTEDTRPSAFDIRPSQPEPASPGGVVVEAPRASVDVSEPEPPQPAAATPAHHDVPYEAPRVPAPGRRPMRRPASSSRFSRHTGVAIVAAAALVVAVVVGAPSIIFGPPFAPVDPAIAPPVSEAELAAAVAALESQPLTGSAPPAVSIASPKAPAAPGVAAAASRSTPVAVTRAPSSKPSDRNANAKRRNAARPAARPEPPRVQNEPAAVTPAPLAAMPIAVPAPAVPAPAAVQTVRPPAGPAYEATQVDARPQVESQVPARVPDHLRDRRFEEALVVRVLVSSAGRASDVRVLRGSRIDASLDAAAVSAVKQWRFSPGRRRGQAVDCWISVGVPFRGEGGGTDR